jgi:hypothetical protein
MELTKRFQVLADAICMRIEFKEELIDGEGPVERAKIKREIGAYKDALALLLRATEAPRYPIVDCALNVANNPLIREAEIYYQAWLDSGRKRM